MSTSTNLRLAGAGALLLLSGLLSACGGGGDSAQAADAPLTDFTPSAESHPEWSKYTFTIGDNGGDGSQELAKATGVFDSAPYKVKFARFDYGPPLVQAAASGDIDLGPVGSVPPITGAAETFGFKIVGIQRSVDLTESGENVIVPKGSPIKKIEDLKGKKIAVPQGSSAHGLALLALKSVGLTVDDVDFVYLSPAAGATAFNTGKVDAWSIWNPQSALAIKAGARIVAKGAPPIDQLNSYYVASSKSLEDPDRRAALTDLLTRVAKLWLWAQDNTDEYAKAVAEETGIPLEDAKTTVEAYSSVVDIVRPEDIEVEQHLSDAFFEAGEIKKKVDVSTISDNLLPEDFDADKLD